METRRLTATTVGIDTCEWPHARQFLRLERQVRIAGRTTKTLQHAVTSLSRCQADAKTLLGYLRGRWEIENRAFWVRDVVFGEDHSRIRTGLAYRSMSVVRNAAINLLRILHIPNLAEARREHALKLDRLLVRLGIVNQS